MPQEDHLQKQIELLGRILGKVLFELIGINTEGRTGASVEETKQALKRELDIDLDEIISLPPEAAISFLKRKKDFNSTNLEVFADILYQMSLKNQEQAGKLNKTALAIYEYINRADRTYSIERQSKIDLIKAVL